MRFIPRRNEVFHVVKRNFILAAAADNLSRRLYSSRMAVDVWHPQFTADGGFDEEGKQDRIDCTGRWSSGM